MGHNPAKNKKAESYLVPMKFWHCVDDDIVPYEITKRFVERIQRARGMAYLRTFPYGGHEPRLSGNCVENPVGCDVHSGEKIQISPAEEEVFISIRNFS